MAAEGIVCIVVGAIQADGDTNDAGFVNPGGHRFVH